MTIVGRTTANAVVNFTEDGREVVHFTLAINDYYKGKNKIEGVQLTTYVRCSYWRSSKVAPHLTKGTLVEVSGRIYSSAYISRDGEAKASIECHVHHLKIHGGGNRSSNNGVVNSSKTAIISDVQPITENTPF